MKKNLLLLSISASLFSACTKPPLEVNEELNPSTKNLATVSATTYTASLDAEHTILMNACGYNPRNYMLTEPYTGTHDPDIQPALVSSEANIIRYPGGTFANYWDYANDRMFQRKETASADGWVNASKVNPDPTDQIRKRIENGITAPNGNGILANSVNDLKYAAKGGTSGEKLNVVFHMNMVTPGKDFYESPQGWNRTVNGNPGSADWYAMLNDRYERFKAMLIRAKSGPDPITVRFIELGNEYFFPIDYVVEAFPQGSHHGTASNYIANKLINDTDLNLGPNLRIAATGAFKSGGDARKVNWNNSLKTTLNRDSVGYITLHAYEAFVEPASYTEANFQNKLVDWYQKVNDHFQNSDADANFVQASTPWKVWYTETNANWEGGFDGDPSGEKEWGQWLVDAYSIVHLYGRGNAAMILQFQFNNQVKPNAEIVGGRRLYNRALALKPFMEASKDATSAARVSFAGSGMPKLPDNTKAVVQGYLFKTSAGAKQLVLINLSGTTKNINLGANIFTSGSATLNKEGYKNDLASTATATIINTTDNKADVSLPPYSVVRFYQ